ncbi:hypothetical protein ACFWY5_18865 [Nonomuraea sp. NPDC059007]|uniref:hypothetical protein n=1 Tax=Nonomuraea sp. NPDC059007 TaxID=3346692 RepID=UPI00368C7571
MLFALDEHTLTAKARQRVAAVTARIGSGPVSVEGHTGGRAIEENRRVEIIFNAGE